jgi:hypothetical protein
MFAMLKIAYVKRFVVIAILVIWLGGMFPALPASAQSDVTPASQAQNLSVNIPTLVFPTNTIPIKRIIYIWTSVSGATKYQVQVYHGSDKILNTVTGIAICTSGTCSIKAGSDLSNGTYTWRIRALVGGAFQPYSAWQTFIVAAPDVGFYSPFTNNAEDWVIYKGLWNLENTNYFTTTGSAGYTSSIGHKTDYSLLTYEVRMKRSGCAGCANVIIIRGNPILDSAGWWQTEYTFDYTNNGLFSVWKDYHGSYTALKDWTSTTAINNGDWNTLKVTANGAQLKFYINDKLVWSGNDATYDSGRVGIAMYRNPTISGDKLWVDWAKLDTAVAASTDAILLEGVEVPGGNKNTAP